MASLGHALGVANKKESSLPFSLGYFVAVGGRYCRGEMSLVYMQEVQEEILPVGPICKILETLHTFSVTVKSQALCSHGVEARSNGIGLGNAFCTLDVDGEIVLCSFKHELQPGQIG
ncbi:hypothetical protein VNO78_20896 [Psophocarpus tetragonolobus]|uniref:Uncharacterized protein n=1 Tax=Psophocarpus tetragonolobus TaxID=3891 RepID=A0AAN9SFK6_PSOTE